jgi:peptide deformylase
MVQQREVLTYPDPRLREAAPPVKDVSQFRSLVEDLVHTMFLCNAVGIAAPQVGAVVRVFVLDSAYFNERGKDPLVFFNPELVKVSPTKERRREGCLSFPGYGVHVVRPSWVSLRALDLDGNPFEVCSEGDQLLSKALQHELDHLNGILLCDVADVRERRKLHEAMVAREI